MGIPRQALRLEVRGAGPGSELWMCGFFFDNGGAPHSLATVTTIVNAVYPRFATWWAALAPTCLNTYSMTELRGYTYPGGGNASDYEASHSFSPVVAGALAGGSPIDTALVVSLHTARVGRSYRGRAYLPIHKAITNTGLYASTEGQTYVNATKALFAGIQADVVVAPVVCSRLHESTDLVTSLSADQKPDVQRRRENRLNAGSPFSVSYP